MALIALLPVANAVRLVASAASQALTRSIPGAVSKPLQQSVRAAMQSPTLKAPTTTTLNTGSSAITTTMMHTTPLKALNGASGVSPGMTAGLGLGAVAVPQFPKVSQVKATSSPSLTATGEYWSQYAQAVPNLTVPGLVLKAGQALTASITGPDGAGSLTARLSITPEAPRNDGFQIHQPAPSWTVSPIPQRSAEFVRTVPMVDEHWLSQLKPPGRESENINSQIEGFATHAPSAEDTVLLKKTQEPSTLIIGTTGALAPALALEAQRRHPEAKVYGTSRQGAPPESFRIPGVEYIETPNGLADITVDLLHQTKPRYVFNLANTSGPAFETAFDVNVAQRYKIMQTVDWYAQHVDWPVAHPILSSHSVYKYGRQLNENSPPDNTRYYGATTYTSELIGLAARSKIGVTRNENLDVAVFRIPTLMGVPPELNFVPPRVDRPSLNLNYWVMQAATTGHIAADSPPAAFRPYGYSPDIAAQIFNVMTHADTKVRNVMPIVLGRPGKDGEALSAEEAIQIVVDVAKHLEGKKVSYEFATLAQRPKDRDITVDTSFYHSLFPDHQPTPLVTAIERLYLTYLRRPK